MSKINNKILGIMFLSKDLRKFIGKRMQIF